MRARVRKCLLPLLLAVASLWPAAARAGSPPVPDLPPGLPPELCAVAFGVTSPAISLFCVPPGWDNTKDLVVFAHGYVANVPGELPELPDLNFGGVNLALVAMQAGFAFGTTSYRQDGLAILEGAEDIRQLVSQFTLAKGAPNRTIVTGASEGGLVATLLLERHPDEFDAGLAACGPIGSFRGQVNYVGDFRVLFDYFFPNVIPGTAIDVPPDVRIDWTTVYLPAIQNVLLANPGRAFELMRTAKAAYDPANFATVIQTTANVLSYNVFGGPDAEAALGGNPFSNLFRLYFGSSNDLRLNLRVQRFAASPVALAAMRQYETSGHLTRRLVTLHTTADEVIPFWHETLYFAKVLLSGHSGLVPLPVARYGHCNFTATEILTAFALTVQ